MYPFFFRSLFFPEGISDPLDLEYVHVLAARADGKASILNFLVSIVGVSRALSLSNGEVGNAYKISTVCTTGSDL